MKSQLREIEQKRNAEAGRRAGRGGTSDEPKREERPEEPPSDRQHVTPRSLGEPSGWEVADETSEAARPEEGLQARIDKLLDAANAASTHARNVYVTFLLFGLYLAIIFGSTTHEQLLRESPVTLPLLNVELPLGGFYLVAPTLFVLLHLNLLIQLFLLSQKLHRLDGALREVGDREGPDDWRAQLTTFPFGQMLIGWQHGPVMKFLLWLMVWLSVLFLPLILLLFGQVSFLPYHDAWTTSWHRFLVAADVLLLAIFWCRIAIRQTGCWSTSTGGSGARRCRVALSYMLYRS